MKNRTILADLAFISTLLVWTTLIIGFLYAQFYLDAKAESKEIFSPRTGTQLYIISALWVISPFLELLAICALVRGQKNKKVITAVFLNALPVLSILLLMALNNGHNIGQGCEDVLELFLAPFR